MNKVRIAVAEFRMRLPISKANRTCSLVVLIPFDVAHALERWTVRKTSSTKSIVDVSTVDNNATFL